MLTYSPDHRAPSSSGAGPRRPRFRHAAGRQGLPMSRSWTGSTGQGGRGSSITENGHRFDLGPTIVTYPTLLEDLWRVCGQGFFMPMWTCARSIPSTRSAGRMAPPSRPAATPTAWSRRSARLSPGDVKGYLRFLKGSRGPLQGSASQGLGRIPMHDLMETVKVLPAFVPPAGRTARSSGWPRSWW